MRRSLLTLSAVLALAIAVPAQSARGPREDSESTSAGARAGGAPLAPQMKTSTPADGKIGAGVTLKEATTIKDLYDHPEKFLNKKIRSERVGPHSRRK